MSLNSSYQSYFRFNETAVKVIPRSIFPDFSFVKDYADIGYHGDTISKRKCLMLLRKSNPDVSCLYYFTLMKNLLALIFATMSLSVFAQSNQTEARNLDADFKKNIVKLNFFALPLRNFSLQYERGLNENISVSMGVSLLPKGSMPFQNAIENTMDIEKGDTADAGLDFVRNAKISSWAITPEFRYYFGKKPLNGFYIAPFVRFSGYNIDWNYKYERDNGGEKPVNLKGKSNGIAGGILFGAQWHMGKHLVLDWWILGPQYGSYNFTLEASGDFSDLTPDEKADLEDIIEDIGFSGNKFEATVTNTSVKAENKIGLPGLRTGLCLGFTF